MKTRRKITFSKIIVFQVILIVLFFGIAEIGLRLFFPSLVAKDHLIQPESIKGHLYINQEACAQLDPLPTELEKQKDCRCQPDAECRLVFPYRESSFSCEPEPDTLRILFLGASSVWGAKLQPEASIPSNLQRLANNGGYRVEVINGGVSGKSICYCAISSRYFIPKLKPDLVILYAGHNQIYPMRWGFNKLGFRLMHPWAAWSRPAYDHSALLRASTYLLKQKQTQNKLKPFTGMDGYRELEPRHPIILDAQSLQKFTEFKQGLIKLSQTHLASLYSYTKSMGIPLIYCTPTSNMTMRPLSFTHGPSYLAHRQSWDKKMAEAEAAMTKSEYRRAADLLFELAEMDPHHALTHYLAGINIMLDGRPLEAMPHLRRTLDELYLYSGDPELEGAPPMLLDGLAAKAKELGIPVWDAGTNLRGGDDPTNDNKFFIDYVHYSKAGSKKLSTELLSYLIAEGWLDNYRSLP